MSREYKICANCGAKVDINYNFCPNCKSQAFNEQPMRAQPVNPPSRVAQTLLYWNYDGDYVLSKAKVGGILTFLFLFISGLFSPFPAGMFLVAIIFSAIAYLVGYVIHHIKGKPSEATIIYNNYGVVPDLIHLFFFWQNKNTGEFVPSKTKIISAIIFVVFCLICAFTYSEATFVVIILFGLVFEVPAFLVGCGIHKLTNPNPTNPPKQVKPKKEPKKIFKRKAQKVESPKVETPRVEVNSRFGDYEDQINDLKVEYEAKEKVARDLIEKRFTPPQITYTRFISIVDKASEIFNTESESALNILHLASEDSPRIDAEIKLKIDVLKSIIKKTDDLTNELVLSMDSAKETNTEDLIEDMERLISSVKDYDDGDE